MFFRALIAFLILPGIAGILSPAIFAVLDPWRCGPIWQGSILVLAGLVLLLWCVRDFHVQGKGTLAPWDPPQHLVVVGPYRHKASFVIDYIFDTGDKLKTAEGGIRNRKLICDGKDRTNRIHLEVVLPNRNIFSLKSTFVQPAAKMGDRSFSILDSSKR